MCTSFLKSKNLPWAEFECVYCGDSHVRALGQPIDFTGVSHNPRCLHYWKVTDFNASMFPGWLVPTGQNWDLLSDKFDNLYREYGKMHPSRYAVWECYVESSSDNEFTYAYQEYSREFVSDTVSVM